MVTIARIRIAACVAAEIQTPGSLRLTSSLGRRTRAAPQFWSGAVTSATFLKPPPVTIAITCATRP